jgi:hypothetical protein
LIFFEIRVIRSEDILISVPETKDGLKPAVGEAHRRYSRRINFRESLAGALMPMNRGGTHQDIAHSRYFSLTA